MKQFIFLLLLVTSTCGYSQNRSDQATKDLERLQELHDLVMNNRISEFEAKKEIMNFYYAAKDLVMEKSLSLTDAQSNLLRKAQEQMWKPIQADLDSDYLNSHPSHLRLYLYTQYERLKLYEYHIKYLAHFFDKNQSLGDFYSTSARFEADIIMGFNDDLLNFYSR